MKHQLRTLEFMEVYWGVIITRYISSEKNQSLLPASLPSKAKLNFLPVWVRGSLFIAGTDSPSCNAGMIFFFQLQMFPSCGKHRYKYSFLCLKRKWLPITVNIPSGFLASTHTQVGEMVQIGLYVVCLLPLALEPKARIYSDYAVS